MKKNLLFISLEHWDQIWRRNQFLAVRLQKDFALTFIGPELPFWQIFKPKIFRYQNIKIRYAYKFFPEKYFPGLNKLLYKLQTTIYRRDILWNNDHSKYFLNAPRIIYDITDDWTILDPKIKKADDLLCQKAERIIVCSENLLRARAKFKAKTKLIKNGVDFKPLKPNDKPGKYFLYTGSLHEERIDVSLVIALAKNYPAERFVFIGPSFFAPQIKEALNRYKNIELWGPRPYQELNKYMNEAKALLVPHLTTSFVNSLDPIKQYEYMLSDKPVVTTKVSGFKNLNDIFYVAQNKTEFLQAIEKIIKNRLNVNLPLRLKYARENSWDKRYNQVKEILC
jgi:hypothetical protein